MFSFFNANSFLLLRCNGKKECQDGRDEHKCNVSLEVLLWLLSIGFGFISLTGGILQCFHKKNKALEIPSQDDLDDHKQLSLEDQHKGGLISERFSHWSFPQKMCQINNLNSFYFVF